MSLFYGGPGVYLIKSKYTGKKYIGSSVDMAKRLDTHFNQLSDGEHYNYILQDHYNKYGPDDLDVTILIICSEDFLGIFEQIYINKMKPEFNIQRIVTRKISPLKN